MNVPVLKAEVQLYNCLRQKVMDQYLDRMMRQFGTPWKESLTSTR